MQEAKKILLLVIGVALLGVSGTKAANVSLNISPSTLTVNQGFNFSVTGVVSTLGDKVCTVKGTIVFNTLTCQGITLAEGLMPQQFPTCADPHFVIGIPKCTTANRNVFVATVKPSQVGTASISFNDVNIIGEGIVLGSDATGGMYTVNALPLPPKNPTPSSSLPVVAQSAKSKPAEKEQPLASTDTTIKSIDFNQTAALQESKALERLLTWVEKNVFWLVLLLLLIAVAIGGYYWQKKKEKKIV